MCTFDEFAGRLFISFRFTMFMMEIKPEIVDRIMTHSTTVVAAKFNRFNQQVNILELLKTSNKPYFNQINLLFSLNLFNFRIIRLS